MSREAAAAIKMARMLSPLRGWMTLVAFTAG